MNIKRFLLVLPIIFILILGVVPFGSALAADEDYFLPADTLGFEEFESSDYPITHTYNVLRNAGSSILDYYNNSNFSDCLYFYSYQMSIANYSTLSTSDQCYFNVNFYLVPFNSSPSYEDDDYYIYPVVGSIFYQYLLSSDRSSYSEYTASHYNSSSYNYLVYNKHTGVNQVFNLLSLPPNFSDSVFNHMRSGHNYIFYQDTNISDFPLVNSGGSGLNVDVRFRPGLSGEVDRMLEDSEGVRSLMSDMRMTVVNNSRTAIQYKMAIYKKNQVTHRDYNISDGRDAFISASYDDDPIFVYYSNEWVYSTDLSSSSSWYNGHVQKQNKASEWHYVAAGGAVAVRLNYSQINLVEGTEYTCIVQAVACPYDNASRMWVTQASSEAAYPEYKQIFSDDIEVVYQSDFIMTHYSDVHYDPTDTSNGVLPYSKYSDGESYTFSYNAVEDSEGNVDYTPKNLYTDKNSWWHTQYHPNDITVPGGFSSGGSTYNNLGSTVSSFFSLITSVLGYFPSSVNTVFGLGVIAIVVAGFFKAVFKS